MDDFANLSGLVVAEIVADDVSAHLRGRPWAQTKSGRAFPLIDPEPSDVFWPDIAWALAHTNRFAGHAGTYSDAQHSVLVANQMPLECKLYGLLHDAHEAYIGDITRPCQRALAVLCRRSSETGDGDAVFEDAISDLKYGIDKAVFAAAGLPPIPKEIQELLKGADIRVMMTEVRDLMAPPPAPWAYSAVPLPEKIVAWNPGAAFLEFGVELAQLLGKQGLTLE